jgi:membrane protein YdbS with pleckstrin-like domain
MRNEARPEEDRWRGDPAVAWLIAIEVLFLVVTTAALITLFRGSGFWPWLVLAGAIVVGWLAAVAILIPRSARRR